MDRRTLSVLLVLAYAAVDSEAEVTRLPFFTPPATFADSSEAFPSFSTWILLDHGLNQNDTPNEAHRFDSGSSMTLYANRRFSVSCLAREIFQFKPSPDGAFQFWARSLVTDLRLSFAIDLSPVIAGAGYRHDCKHDISDTQREVIHDTVSLFAQLPPFGIPFMPPALNASFGLNLECEANVPLIFQPGEKESDRARFSAEAEIVPFATSNGLIRTFLDARVSVLGREENDRVAVASGWNLDWLFRAGTEFRSGLGGVRLLYSLERLTDDWATLEPSPMTISAVTLLLFYRSSSQERISLTKAAP